MSDSNSVLSLRGRAGAHAMHARNDSKKVSLPDQAYDEIVAVIEAEAERLANANDDHEAKRGPA